MKREIFTVLFIGIIILLAGCTSNKEHKTVNYTTPQEPMVNESTQIKNESLPAKEVIEIKGCKGQTYDEVDQCLYLNKYCSEIRDLTLKDKCNYEEHNCDKILDKDLRDKCNYEEKMRACEDEEFPSLCRAQTADDIKFCGDNTECALKFAYLKGDEKLCDYLNDTSNIICRAAVTGNHYLCYKELDIEAYRRTCLVEYSKLTGRDGNICDGLSSEFYTDDCNYKVALYSNDPKLCRKIHALQTWRKCVMEIAQQDESPNACEYAYDDDSRDYCIYIVAKQTYTPKFCENIKDPGDLWRCFGDSIVKGKITKEKCDEISNEYEEWKTECYSNLE